jgi:MFS transporter, ACS family, D-galactonate transporter
MATNPAAAPADASRISHRVLALLAFSVFINYVDRSNLSVAAPMLKDELGLSATQLGVLLSAFFWTYAGLQLTSGWLVDHFEVKWVFAGGFLIWSTATAMTGLAHSFAVLLVVRIVLGMGESVAYPSYSKIMANHCGERHRGFANSMIAMGLALGPAFGVLFGGTLMSRFGWRPFFIILGAASLVWLVPWLLWMPRTPAHTAVHGGPAIAEIIRQRSLWGTCLALFCGNYHLYFMVTWLPYYLMRECGLSMNGMAKVGGAFFLLAAMSASMCGRFSDRWIASGATPNRVRKTFLITASLGIGISLVANVASSGSLAIAWLLMAAGFFGAGSSNIWAVTQTLAGPQAVGRWAGVQLFCGNMSGVVVPAVTGVILQRTGHFAGALLIVAAISWIGALTWAFVVGPVEPVLWRRSTLAGFAPLVDLEI